MKLAERFLVKPGQKIRLARIDPGDTAGVEDKSAAEPRLDKNLKRLAELQYLMYAENRRSLLVVLQAMDAAGKDGTIRHVMTGLNPQGCRVTPFKAPSQEELDHDYLWRIHKAVPRRGEIGIFNRSHYEDVLVVRVHGLVPKGVWSGRYDQINGFERMLSDEGTAIVKFFLHISRQEQKRRFEARLEDETRHWKLSPADFEERKYWNDYHRAYEDALARCSTPWAPWYVVPSDRKWFRNLAVSQIIVETLESFRMKFPKPSFDVSKMKLD
jgi:PPK2 family polyphosphate:nucleotide phosphotransferase